PVVAYATFLGGSATDFATAVAVDASGAAYIVGNTASANFAGTSLTTPRPASPVFVTKLASDGTLVFTAFVGGSGSQTGSAVALDGSGAIYLAGFTDSS